MHVEHDIRLYNVKLANNFGRNGQTYKSDPGATEGRSTADSHLTITQEKFLRVMIARIADDQIAEVAIPVGVFKRAMGITSATATVKHDVIDLDKKSFTLQGDDTIYRLVEYVRESDGVFYAKLHESLHPLLIGLTEKYYRYPLGFICGLRTKYAIRLYEYLRSWAGVMKCSLRFEDLREILDFPYECAKDIERRVIEPAISEINRATDIKVTYTVSEAQDLYYSRIIKVGINFKIVTKGSDECEQALSDAGVHEDEIVAFHSFQDKKKKSTKSKKSEEAPFIVSRQSGSSEKVENPEEQQSNTASVSPVQSAINKDSDALFDVIGDGDSLPF